MSKPVTSKRMRWSHTAGAYYATCCHCGRRTAVDKLTIDHIRPRSKGGRLSKKNTALACSPCNTERGDQDFWEFREKKRAQIVGHPVDLSQEPPTREQWTQVHAKQKPPKPPRAGKRSPISKAEEREAVAWWLEHRWPTPKDSL